MGLCGERRPDEIGIHALRGGTVAGTHSVHFFGPDEELEFTHRATSRRIFVLGALKAARKILTPVLRPLIGIPGSAALALIASMQSTDGGAALTRQLKDAGELTESETNTFAAFQMTADAPITNFFSSGAVLFTLVAADGTLAVPVSLGLCLGVILLGKVLSANMMRLLQIRASRK